MWGLSYLCTLCDLHPMARTHMIFTHHMPRMHPTPHLTRALLCSALHYLTVPPVCFL